MARSSIPSATKRLVRERDQSCCRKCCRREALDIHHVKAVVDGGTNEPDNLVLLCMACHWEWHTITMIQPDYSFTEWVELPPINLILAWLTTDYEVTGKDISFTDAKMELIRNFYKLRNKFQDTPMTDHPHVY